MVELLLDNGADVNAKKMDGWTPLRFATSKQHADVARSASQARRDRVNSGYSGRAASHVAKTIRAPAMERGRPGIG